MENRELEGGKHTANVEAVVQAIQRRDVRRLLPHIMHTDVFDQSPVLRRLLWETFLPACDEDTLGPLQAIDPVTMGQLKVDLARSLHHFDAVDTTNIGAHRERLQVLLVRLFEHPRVSAEDHSALCYYQGLHDLASVLVLLFRFKEALRFAQTLCRSHLREFMRPDMDATVLFSELVMRILERHDRPVHDRLRQLEMPPFFFVSWFLCWFAHENTDYRLLARFFDFFVVMPPAAVGYACATLIASPAGRRLILDYRPEVDDLGDLHSGLKGLARDGLAPGVLLPRTLRLMGALRPTALCVGVSGLRGTIFDRDAPGLGPVWDVAAVRVGVPLLVLLVACALAAYLYGGRPRP